MSPALKVRNAANSAWVDTGGGAVHTPGLSGTLLSDGVNSSNSTRPSVTGYLPAGSNAWGSWQELDASLSAAAGGVCLHLPATAVSGTNTLTLMQLGTGASSSETAWATFAVGYRNAGLITIPGYIASGTRVSFRSQHASSLWTPTINSANFLSVIGTAPGAPVSMGFDTSTSKGVVLSAPGSLNTKGSWTQITSSTSAAFTSLLVCPQFNGLTAMNGSGVLIDIGIGASSSETVLIGDIYLALSGQENYTPQSPLTFGVNIPSGSRLSARYARQNGTNQVDLCLVGA